MSAPSQPRRNPAHQVRSLHSLAGDPSPRAPLDSPMTAEKEKCKTATEVAALRRQVVYGKREIEG